jgi:hypothetical protein
MLGDYTAEALSMFPRYNVLRAIREAIEAIRWQDARRIEDLRQQLVDIGWTANDAFTERMEPQVAVEVMKEERKRFSDFVRTITSAELAAVEPLPHRRSLSDAESKSIRKRLKQRWAIDGYWHPIEAERLPDDVLANVIAFQARHFESEVGAEKVQGILRDHGVGFVWELREMRPDLEIELSLVDLLYTEERFWTASQMDWVVYVSHESSTTIGGEWLIGQIKRVWPGWERRVYVDWNYE